MLVGEVEVTSANTRRQEQEVVLYFFVSKTALLSSNKCILLSSPHKVPDTVYRSLTLPGPIFNFLGIGLSRLGFTINRE